MSTQTTELFTDQRDEPSPGLVWERDIQMQRPCPCGCDERGGPKGVGYLTGGREGAYVTVWAPDEESYAIMRRVFGGEA